MFENYYNIELKKFDVHEDKDNEKLYLSLIYKAENNLGVFEITIPKVLLDISTKHIPRLISRSSSGYVFSKPENVLSTGKMVYFLDNDKNNSYMNIKQISKKIHEMTLSEIEKKLGYKIKIVNDETHVS